tara:strand:- start:444 stop:1073 length:630 start_codon:yes stop_codon:yes gene_type:complete
MEDPQETKYDKEIKTYYDNKLLSQTRSRYAKCSGCETTKTFTSKDGYLVYSCGGRSGKCGPQTKIRLAQYIYYPDTLRDTNKVIQRSYDPKIFQGLVPQDILEDQLDFLKQNKQLKQTAVIKYKSQNKLSEKAKQIETLHHKRLHTKKQQIELLDKLKQEQSSEAKQEIRKEYIQSVKKLESDYLDLQKSFEKISPFIVVKPGSVTQLH